MASSPQSPVAVVSGHLVVSDLPSSFSRGHTRPPNRPQNCSNQITSDDDKTDEAVTALDPAFLGLRVDTSCARSLDMIDLELPPLSPLTPVPSDFEYDHLSSAPPVTPRRGPSRALKKQRKANYVPPGKPKVTRRPSVKPAARISVASRAQREDRVAAASRDPAVLARKQSLRSSAKKPVGRSKKKSSGRKGAAATTSLGKRTARKLKPPTPARAPTPPLIYDTTGPTPDWIRRSTRLNPGMSLPSAAAAPSPAPLGGASPGTAGGDSFAGVCAEPTPSNNPDDAAPPAPAAGPTVPAADDASAILRELASPTMADDTSSSTQLPTTGSSEDASASARSATAATSPSSDPTTLPDDVALPALRTASMPPETSGHVAASIASIGAPGPGSSPPVPCPDPEAAASRSRRSSPAREVLSRAPGGPGLSAPPSPAATSQVSSSSDPSTSLRDALSVSNVQIERPPAGHPFAIKCVACARSALNCIQGKGKCCISCWKRRTVCSYKELPFTRPASNVERKPGSSGIGERSSSALHDLPIARSGFVPSTTREGEAAPADLRESGPSTHPHRSHKEAPDVPTAPGRRPFVRRSTPYPTEGPPSLPPTGRPAAGRTSRKRPTPPHESEPAPLDRGHAALPSSQTYPQIPPTPASMPRKRRRVEVEPDPNPEPTSVQDVDMSAPHARSKSLIKGVRPGAEQRVNGAGTPPVPDDDITATAPHNETHYGATSTLPDASHMQAPARERSEFALTNPAVLPEDLDQPQWAVLTPAAMQSELPERSPEPRRSKRKRPIVNMREVPLPPVKKRARVEREVVVEKPRERLIIRIPARSRSQTSAEDALISDAAAMIVNHPRVAIAEASPSSRADGVDQGDDGEMAALRPPSPENVAHGRKRLWKDIARPRPVSISPKRPPLPSGCRPQLWAQTRQEICETVPWFRTYQAGVYSRDNVVYGYMLGGCSAPRDVFEHEGRVIISHIGGGQEMVYDDDGGNDPAGAPAAKGPDRGRKTRLRENQGESFRSHGAALNSAWKNQHPVVLLADCQYANFPYEFAPNETYYALGWYWIKDMWDEAEPGKQPTDSHSRVKVCFQWVESQGNPWWWPPTGPGQSSTSSDTKAVVATDRVTQLRPQRQHRPQKVFSVQIRERSLGLGPHRQTCPECNSTSKRIYLLGWMCLNARCDAFWTLEDGTSPRGEKFDMDPAFIALEETPPHVAALIRDYRPALPATSNETAFTTSRSFHQGFLCDKCGRVSTRSRWESWQCPGCPNRFAINWPSYKASAWQAADGVPPCGQYRIHDESVKLQHLVLRVDDHGTIARVNKFIMPHNRGCIYHIIGNDATNAAADGILERYQSDFVEKPLFRRMPLANHGLSTTLLTQYFSQNSGVPYKYVAGTDSTIPFSEAPNSVNMALELITQRARLVAPRAEFNELLTAGYLEGQMMNFHSDYEKGLGEDVAALSLGSPALMKFRYNKSFAHRRVLEFTLNHGDILVMHGTGIQNCYEHTVIPTGFRIAATARLIDSRNALESSALARKPMQIGAAETVGLLPPLDLSGMTLVGDKHLLIEGKPLDAEAVNEAGSDSPTVSHVDQAPVVQGEEDNGLNTAFAGMQIDPFSK